MAKITYKSLFTLVQNEIEKSKKYNNSEAYNSQLTRSTSIANSAPNSGAVISITEIMQAVQDVLEFSMPGRILNGLNVSKREHYIDQITITSGKGTIAGKLYELNEDVSLVVPFDETTTCFYINFQNNAIQIDKSQYDNKLTIAKIVVPKPGTTNEVVNKANGSWDAYIVNFHQYYIYGDENGKFEEDTVSLLRDNIGEILADNLIGNLRLSENLKITNTQGTLELDSGSLKLMDTDGNLLAKFTKDGTFYYNSDGIEIAKFAVDEARIGNIEITHNSIKSSNYASEYSGFKIQDDGFAEFGDVRIRGRLSSSVFEYDKISAVGGKLLIGPATVIAVDMLGTDTIMYVDSEVFEINEVLRINDGTNEEYMLVTNYVPGSGYYTVTRDLGNQYASGEVLPTWTTGIAVVSTGVGGSGALIDGYIMLDAQSQYSPFIDIVDRNSTVYNDVTVRARLGNLGGINDGDFGVLSGFGLYTDNAFIKGSICASCIYGSTIESSTLIGTLIKTSNSYPRVELDSTGLYEYDASGNLITKMVSGSGLCFIDPACNCNYSFLSSGALKFHDAIGDVPYVKRICSGVANTGCTVELLGWTESPYVMVGVKSLKSYDSVYSAQSQKWNVYSEDPYCFTTSGDPLCYGYRFVVHASLELDSGTGLECAKNVAFDSCVTTEACTCATCVRMNFQYWCNNAAPSNYYYGYLCYDICYRKSGDVAWCACSYTYTQPHTSVAELKSTSNTYNAITFPCMETWEIMPSCKGLSFTDSGLCSSSVACCLVTCCISNCNLANLINPGFNCCQEQNTTFTFDAAPDNVYCSCLKFTITDCGHADATGDTYPAYIWHQFCIGGSACWYCCQRSVPGSGAVNITCAAVEKTVYGSTYHNCFSYGRYTCLWGSGSYGDAYWSNGCIVNICQIVCYCCVTGDAASCVYNNMCSLTNTYGCYCILDASGILNWLAISYS